MSIDPRGPTTVAPFSALRQLTVESLQVAGRPRAIHGLIEVDVTSARQRLREWKEATGESLSLTALVVWSVARAVGQHPTVAAYRLGRRRLVTFDDVDVCTLVERSHDGQPIASPHVVRRAQRRGFREIHDEIRAAQQRPLEAEHGARLRYLRAPSLLRRAWLRWLVRSPRRWTSLAGTVCVTSVGMFGGGAGWGLPVSQYPLTVTVGGIARRPSLAGGRLA